MYINSTIFYHSNFNREVFTKIDNNRLIRKNYFSKIKKIFLTEIKNKTSSGNNLFNNTETGKIITADLHSEMSRSYMEYAMSVIYGRALPDVRDGLKPVHRRILFAMSELGLNPDTPFRKCARVVGEVLGKYHPHGDNAVYDALVRMAQDFSMRSVMIFGHGNFGSIDHDPPAAMRYTECKISLLSKELVLKDIYKKTTNFINNFDGSCSEPEILPTRVPILLLNGSNGIAVGMATNIPPHNLTEILKALESLIKNPSLSDNDIVQIVPAPDFPTGGLILGLQGCSKLYKTGQGTITVRARTHYEYGLNSNKTQKNSIIVTEIPYQVNKASLISKIAELVNNKIVEGIVDLRDESDRDGVRVVIELKKDSNKEIILNSLFKKTPLQSSFGAHFLALVGHQPFTLTLRELLLLFLQFRKQTIRKTLQFELGNAIDKNHIVNGLTIATYYTEFILSVIRRSFNTTEAKMTLMESGMTLIQGEAVLNIQLRRLTKLETTRLKREGDQLEFSIQKYKQNLVFSSTINDIILNEFNEITSNFGMPRRTNVIFSKSNGSIDETEMIVNFSTIIMVTKYYIKRMIIETFESQTRGTRGKKGLVIQENDYISHFFSCKNLDTIMCISQSGIAFAIKAFRIPISSRIARGVSLSTVLSNIDLGKIASIIPISNFFSDHFLILLTKKGVIKKTPLQAFKHISARGLVVLKINIDDELGWVRMCTEIDSVLISTEKGRTLRFLANQKQLKATGRTSIGKNSMSVENNDDIVDMDILSYDSGEKMYMLAITKLGYGKKNFM